ncbi:MAG TPA: Hsp70 family protein [Candidatus Limnocylindria bacterium]|nr:Hsp70 family protein [Candidatus Limnocylindria bacterium]
MGYSLGIDLGTTYSAAATARDDRIEIFQLGERAATIPSIVVLRADGEVLTGDAAERRSLSEPTRTAREFKRRLGDPTPIILGGTPYGAESLLAHLLRAIVARVTEQFGGPADAIALTHPASYGAYKVDLLEQAVRLADIANVALLTEPEAAAVHYALQERVPVGAVIAVYDFGGGTFDATILRKSESGFEQLGRPEGMERLGGIDFDEAIFTRVMTLVRNSGTEIDATDPATLAAIARLREECRRAKEALSSDTDVTIPVVLPGVQTEMRLTREEFEEFIRPRITETIAALRRAVKSAGLDFEGIDRVLLVGGTSRIPLIAEMVREATKRPVAIDAHPKHSMALGAALMAETSRRSAADASEKLAGAPVADAALAGAVVAAGPPGGDGGAATISTGTDGPPTEVPSPLALDDQAPPARRPPPSVDAGSASGRGRMIGVLAAVGGIALAAILALVASGMLSPAPAPTGSPTFIAANPSDAPTTPSPSLAPTSAPTLSPTLGPTSVPTPAESATPTATPLPVPTATPEGRQARITTITVGGGDYVVEYETFGYEPSLPGRHVHFFFDTTSVADAGVPGDGPWFVYAGPVPFRGYSVAERPANATQMCILVANGDHSIVEGTGNCMDLPS